VVSLLIGFLGVGPRLTMLWVPVIAVLLYLLTAGLASS